MKASGTLRRIVLTGGPGFGKSSVLESLAGLGYPCRPEAPRQLIVEQGRLEAGILPGTDFPAFAELAARRMLEHYLGNETGPVFFDRALPDIPAYLKNAGLPLTPSIRDAVASHPYDSPVFFFPDWEEIFSLDGVRYESFDEARGIGLLIRESYESLGYNVIEVPRISPEGRTAFILEHLG